MRLSIKRIKREAIKLTEVEERILDLEREINTTATLLAEAQGRVMVACFHLIGAAQPIEFEVSASSLAEPNALVCQQRFVEGRLTRYNADGVLVGVLLATGRIQRVIKVY